MKYREITETPIGNLEVHGMDQPGTFPDVDRKLLTNPQHIERIRKRFELNTFMFDMYFVNLHDRTFVQKLPYEPYPDDKFKRTHSFTDDWSKMLKHSGVVNPEFLKANFNLNIQPKQDVITVVFISNANEENSIPLTPWMVAHRFAHALFDNKDSEGTTLPPELQNALDAIPDRFNNLFNDRLRNPDMKDLYGNLLSLMTNRSAKMEIMSMEYREEMVAQYLTTGRVRLAYSPSIKLRPDADKAKVENRIKQLSNKMTVLVDHIMNECVGLIFLAV